MRNISFRSELSTLTKCSPVLRVIQLEVGQAANLVGKILIIICSVKDLNSFVPALIHQNTLFEASQRSRPQSLIFNVLTNAQ